MADDRAEHVPGCNMAFRRDALVPGRRVRRDLHVGRRRRRRVLEAARRRRRDRVSPAAQIRHHRRASIKGYLKQQRGYGTGREAADAGSPPPLQPARSGPVVGVHLRRGPSPAVAAATHRVPRAPGPRPVPARPAPAGPRRRRLGRRPPPARPAARRRLGAARPGVALVPARTGAGPARHPRLRRRGGRLDGDRSSRTEPLEAEGPRGSAARAAALRADLGTPAGGPSRRSGARQATVVGRPGHLAGGPGQGVPLAKARRSASAGPTTTGTSRFPGARTSAPG